jgi:hypothetical protein
LTNDSSSSSSALSVGGIHFAEIMNAPLGVTPTKQENGIAEVTIGGIATLSEAKLVPGMTYFATTQGSIIEGPPFGSRKVSSQVKTPPSCSCFFLFHSFSLLCFSSTSPALCPRDSFKPETY